MKLRKGIKSFPCPGCGNPIECFTNADIRVNIESYRSVTIPNMVMPAYARSRREWGYDYCDNPFCAWSIDISKRWNEIGIKNNPKRKYMKTIDIDNALGAFDGAREIKEEFRW